MAWTYSGAPGTNAKDEVRFLVGDTDPADPLVQDEEINFVLTGFPDEAGRNNYQAASVVAEAIAARFARKADRSIGTLSVQAKQQHDHYVDVAKRLRGLAVTGGRASGSIPGIPILGGGGRTYLGGDW